MKRKTIRAIVIDHVLVHGLTMREAGLRVQHNLSQFSVSTIVSTFREENRYSILLYFCNCKFTVLHAALSIDLCKVHHSTA